MQFELFTQRPLPRLARLLMAMVIMAGMAVFAAPASAAPPDHSDYAADATVVWEGYCAFPVTVHLVQTGHQTAASDENGTVRKIVAHVVEQDTFSANGKTLESLPYSINFDLRFDAAGNLIHYVSHGQLVKIRMPDGRMLVGAGHVNWLNHLDDVFILEADRGTPVSQARFCAALAP